MDVFILPLASLMSVRKKAAPRNRRSTRSSPPRPLRRLLRQISASAVLAFVAASCALNPNWREQLQIEQLSVGQFSLEDVLPDWRWPALPSLPSLSGNLSTVQSPDGVFVQTSFASCADFFPQRSAPVVPEAPILRELCFTDFALLHSGQYKTPVFVVERLSRSKLSQSSQFKRSDKFYAEARLPQAERAELADYRGSGYSRGHMAPAGDMYSAEGMAQSFSLANMVPQNQRHNAGAWSKIEGDTRKYVQRAQGDVYVYTGPVYESPVQTIGAGKVAIPKYLYKLVYDPNTGKSWVHWHENSPDTKVGAPISYQEFVNRTGLHLLPHLSR